MRNKLSVFKQCFEKPLKVFGSTFVFGIIIGIIWSINSEETTISLLKIGDWGTFKEIFVKNATIILTIYLSVALTDKYAMFVYGLNGTILGATIGKILFTNIKLLLLIIPHGIFEIPCILATGYVVFLGEKFIRNNFKRYLVLLLVHIIAIGICALIEAFITPLFQYLI